jgi:hypothetical protein
VLRLQWDGNPAMPDREDNGMRSIGCRESLANGSQVIAHGPFADPKQLSDLPVRSPTSDVAKDL